VLLAESEYSLRRLYSNAPCSEQIALNAASDPIPSVYGADVGRCTDLQTRTSNELFTTTDCSESSAYMPA